MDCHSDYTSVLFANDMQFCKKHVQTVCQLRHSETSDVCCLQDLRVLLCGKHTFSVPFDTPNGICASVDAHLSSYRVILLQWSFDRTGGELLLLITDQMKCSLRARFETEMQWARSELELRASRVNGRSSQNNTQQDQKWNQHLKTSSSVPCSFVASRPHPWSHWHASAWKAYFTSTRVTTIHITPFQFQGHAQAMRRTAKHRPTHKIKCAF